MSARFVAEVGKCAGYGPVEAVRWTSPVKLLYENFQTQQVFIIVAIFFQGLYLLLRWDWRSPFWRTGVCYLVLCARVWGPPSGTMPAPPARVLLPMTLCFYLLLVRERPGWFWPFFILGSLSVPYGVHEFWLYR